MMNVNKKLISCKSKRCDHQYLIKYTMVSGVLIFTKCINLPWNRRTFYKGRCHVLCGFMASRQVNNFEIFIVIRCHLLILKNILRQKPKKTLFFALQFLVKLLQKGFLCQFALSLLIFVGNKLCSFLGESFSLKFLLTANNEMEGRHCKL